ncbi:MAG: LCP family protein [Armatimonadetes bacterium]|nr:LCP family protein [Armatimonadota bacterium]
MALEFPGNPGLRSRPRRRVGRLIFRIFLVLTLALVTVAAYAVKTRPALLHPGGGDPLQSLADWTRTFASPTEAFGKDRITLLVMGLDQNWTEKDIMYTKGARSDSMILVNLNLADRAVSLLSIPRDTWVEIPGYGTDRINAAHSLGGVPLARQAVETFLGVPIDYHVLLKINAGKDLIDALDGVYLNVEKPMDYDDSWGHLHIHLKPGYRKLTGEQAMGYARFRNDEEGDFGRIRRQQQLLDAILRRMRSPAVLDKVRDLVEVLQKNVETDLQTRQLLTLAGIYRGFQRQKLHTSILKGEDAVTGAGAMVLIPNEEEKRRVMLEFLGTDVTTPIPASNP